MVDAGLSVSFLDLVLVGHAAHLLPCNGDVVCVQMAAPCWTSVVLLIFLAAGNSWAAVDPKWLTSVIEAIKTQ